MREICCYSFCHLLHPVNYGKAMFLQVSVCLQDGFYVTITHDALDLTGTYPRLVTSGVHLWTHRYLPPQEWSDGVPPIVTSDGDHWRPVQTCSILFIWGPPSK